MRFLATISYDGSPFYGYQKQPNKRTVQEELELVLTRINHEKVLVHASGRTDRGVHARNQKIHFDLSVHMTENEVKKAMNSLLPPDLYVKEVERVNDNFHARFDVKKKEYCYFINTKEYDPIQKNYVYQYNDFLDLNRMKEAGSYLIGEHNFLSFTKVDEEKETYVRTIYEVKMEEKDGVIMISFLGDGFMRYMVRNMVGTLIEVGSGKREPEEIKTILEQQDRRCAGKTAPACGLYLNKVIYEENR